MGKFRKDDEPADLNVSSKDEVLRSRLSYIDRSKTDDISDIWGEQIKISQENERIKNEYKQAKIRAKKLKKQIRSNYVGNKPESVLLNKAGKTKKNILNKVNSYKVKSKPLNKSIRPVKSLVGSILINLLNSRKRALVVLLPLIIIGFVYLFNNDSQKDILGTSTDNQTFQSGTLPKEQPAFNLLYPSGKSAQDYDPVRISPDSNEPAYTYIDYIGDTQINVSQQRIPEKIKNDQVTELEALSKSFQATNRISIDENIIYHGYNDKMKIQSVILVKKELLIFIKSGTVLSDDALAGYIISLN